MLSWIGKKLKAVFRNEAAENAKANEQRYLKFRDALVQKDVSELSCMDFGSIVLTGKQTSDILMTAVSTDNPIKLKYVLDRFFQGDFSKIIHENNWHDLEGASTTYWSRSLLTDAIVRSAPTVALALAHNPAIDPDHCAIKETCGYDGDEQIKFSSPLILAREEKMTEVAAALEARGAQAIHGSRYKSPRPVTLGYAQAWRFPLG